VAKIDPTAARAAFLDALTPEEQNRVLRRADKSGPARDDADWLVAYAAMIAVERIEVAVSGVESKTGTASKASRGISTQYNGTALVLWTLVASLSTFSGIAYLVDRLSASHIQALVLYSVAFASGALSTALYAWAAPYLVRHSKRKR
jgi:hypothetical protein